VELLEAEECGAFSAAILAGTDRDMAGRSDSLIDNLNHLLNHDEEHVF
jgi:hypothetical protein